MKFIKVLKANESKDYVKKKVEDLKILCDRLLKSIDVMNDEDYDKMNAIIQGVNDAYSDLIQEIVMNGNIKLTK